MRIWTLHPRYLDRQGLLAVWREGLLAQAVLLGKTKGYRHHPQLIRFRDHPSPVAAIATYLEAVCAESLRRGYRFDASRIHPDRTTVRIRETTGQLHHEWNHLRTKLERRSPDVFSTILEIATPDPHPLFILIPGAVRTWEKSAAGNRSVS